MDNPAHILVIDDEKSIRKFLRASLSVFGYQIDEAINGEEGINMIATHHPDLVILDLSLPDIEGLEV